MKKSNKKSTLSGTTEINFIGTKTYIKSTPPIVNKLKKNKVIEDGDYSKSIDDYLEKRKNEVPLYDPLTGEPNPYYEKLTGKKNPLTITPKTLNPSIREVKLKNRFLVYLPKDFNIDIWDVKSIIKPRFTVKRKKIFGIPYGYEIKNNDIILLVNDYIGIDNNKLLNYLEQQKRFSFYIEELDPTGVVIETTKFDNSLMNSINFGDLDYQSTEINKITIKISFEKITIK